MSWLLALSVTTVHAHTPHDGALFATSWPEGGSPVITTIYRDSGVLLTRLGDDSTDSQTRFMAPQQDDIRTVVYVDSERLIAATGPDGLWISDDAGDRWSVHPDLSAEDLVGLVSASPMVDTDSLALAGASSGLWRTADRGETWSQVWETSSEILAVTWSDTFDLTPTVCALTDADQVICSHDAGETWSESWDTPEALTDLGLSGTRTFWGAGSTGVWISTADSPWGLTGLEGTVNLLTVLDDGTLLATRPDEGVWRSVDDGDTWMLATEGLDTSLTGIGAPRDGLHYRQLVQERSGRILLATWNGLYASDDAGETWSTWETEMPWTTRALDISPSTDGAAWVFLGKYGGGTTMVRADGSEAQPVGASMKVRYTRSVSLGRGESEAQHLLVTDYDSVEVSHDGGLTWLSTAGEDWSEIGYVEIEEDNALALLAGDNLNGATVVRSTDGGLTWSPSDTSTDCIGGGRRLLDLPVDKETQPETWGGCRIDAAVFVSLDQGITWTSLGSPTPNWLMQVRGLPGEPAAYAGTTEGLYRVTTTGEATQVAFEGQQVSALDVSSGWSSDGTAFALISGEGWYRTQDYGETWTALPLPTLAHAEAIALSPDFARDQTLAVATYDGAWASADAGETWTPITGVDRIEENHGLWQFGEGWEQEKRWSTSGGSLLSTDWPGTRATVSFEGVAFDLVGRTYVDGGSLAVSVDGGEPHQVDLTSEARHDQADLLRVRDLAPGHHTITIEVLSAPAGLDALLAWHSAPDDGPADTADPSSPEPGNPESCNSCATMTTQLSPSFLLSVLALGWCRRRPEETSLKARAQRFGTLPPPSRIQLSESPSPPATAST